MPGRNVQASAGGLVRNRADAVPMQQRTLRKQMAGLPRETDEIGWMFAGPFDFGSCDIITPERDGFELAQAV